MIELWIWGVIALVAIILGAVVDIFDKGRKTSAFGIAIVFAVVVGFGYAIAYFAYLASTTI